MEKEAPKFSFFNKRSDTKNGKSDTTKTTDGGFFKKQKILIRPVINFPKQSAEVTHSSNEDEAYDPFQPTEDILDAKSDEAYDPFEPTASDNDDDSSVSQLQSSKSLYIPEINEDVLSPTSTQSSENADVFDVDRLLDSKFDASFASKQFQKSDIKAVTAKHQEKKKTPLGSDFDIFAEEELEKAQAAALPPLVEPSSPEPPNSKKFNKLRRQIKSAFSSEIDPLASNKNKVDEKENSLQENLRINTESKTISAVEDDIKLESKTLVNVNASDALPLLNSSSQSENDKVLKTKIKSNQENVTKVSDKNQKVFHTPDEAITEEKSCSNKSLSPNRKKSRRHSRSPSYKRHRSRSKKRSRSNDRKPKKSLEKSRKERSRSRSTGGKRRKRSRSRSRPRSHKKSNRSRSRTPRQSAKKRKRSRSRSRRSTSRKKQAQTRSRSPQKQNKKKRKSRSRSRRHSTHRSQRSWSKSPKKRDKKSRRSKSKSKSRSHAVTDSKRSRSKTPKKSFKKSHRSRSKSKSGSPCLKLDFPSKSPKKLVKKSRKSRSKSKSKSPKANLKRSHSRTPKKNSKRSHKSRSKSLSPQSKADSKHTHSKTVGRSGKKSHHKSRSKSKSRSPGTKHSYSTKISSKEKSDETSKILKSTDREKATEEKASKKKKKDGSLSKQESLAKQRKEDADDKKYVEKQPQVKSIDIETEKSELVRDKVHDIDSVGKSTKKKKKKKKHAVEESSDMEELSQSKKKKKHKKHDNSAVSSSEEKSIKAPKKSSHYKDDDESDYERKSKKKKKRHHHSDESDFDLDTSDVSKRSKKHKRHAQSPDREKSPQIKEKKNKKKHKEVKCSYDEFDVDEKESKKKEQKHSSLDGQPQTESDIYDFDAARKSEKQSFKDNSNDKNELGTFLTEKQSETNLATDEVKSVDDAYNIKKAGSVDLSVVENTVAETAESVNQPPENADKIASNAQDLDIDFLLEEPFKYAEDDPALKAHEKDTLDLQSYDPLEKKELRSPSPLSPSLLSPASSPLVEEINSQNSSMIMSSQEFKETPSYAETFLEQSRKRWEKSLRTKSPHVSATPDDNCASESSQKKPSTVKSMQGLFSLSDISLDTAEKSKMSSDDATNIETSASVEDIFADFSDNTSKDEQPKTVQSTTFESVMKLEATDVSPGVEAKEKVPHFSTTSVSQDTDIRGIYEDIKLNAEKATTTEEAGKKTAVDKLIKESSPKAQKARSRSPGKDERSPAQRKRSRSPYRSDSKRHEDRKKQDRRRRSRSYERRSRRRRSPSRSPQRKHSHRKRNSSRDKRRSERSKSPDKSRYRQERKRTSQPTDRALGNQPANIAMASQATDLPLAAQSTGIALSAQFNESALSNQAAGIFLTAQPQPDPINIEMLNKFLEQSAKYASLPVTNIAQEQTEKVSTSPQPIATISGVASSGFLALPRTDENLHISEDIEHAHEIATSTFQTLVRESRPALIQIPTIDSHTSELETAAKPTKNLETKPAEGILLVGNLM